MTKINIDVSQKTSVNYFRKTPTINISDVILGYKKRRLYTTLDDVQSLLLVNLLRFCN